MRQRLWVVLQEWRRGCCDTQRNGRAGDGDDGDGDGDGDGEGEGEDDEVEVEEDFGGRRGHQESGIRRQAQTANAQPIPKPSHPKPSLAGVLL